MSFDGIFTHVMTHELNNFLTGGRINKIHQPYDNEIILTIRNHRTNFPLLLSAHPSYARVQITKLPYQNPATPSNFSMMLRKYLDGAIIEKIYQIENDRILHFEFSKRNELGDLENVLLIVELMGRHSNIILLDQKHQVILDTIKHIGPSQNTYRTLLPGSTYIAPPKAQGVNPFTVDKVTLFEILSQNSDQTSNYLQKHFQGLGKDSSFELLTRLQQKPNEKVVIWQDFFTNVADNPRPTIVETGEKTFFTPIPYKTIIGESKFFDTGSELLDSYYSGKAEKDRVKQQTGEIVHRLENEHKKNQTKIKKLERSLADTENAEIYRQKGELLTTFMSQVPKGAPTVTLENYYTENTPLEIALNPAVSPARNAQKYFQKYQKLKKSVHILGEQIEKAKQENNYLESVLSQIELATPIDMEMIREELLQEGYIKLKQRQQKRKQKRSKPETYTASNGTTILVGRNNLQNDQLTLKTARKNYIWLHAKDIPGSHVIITDSDPDETTLIEAANLAAYFSKFRLSASVPVDYTQVKNVHKPNGAKPGFVIYEQQKTVYITPKKELIDQLKENTEASK